MLNKETSVYLIAGSEQYLKREKLDEIKAAFLDKDSAELNFNVFYADTATAQDVLECLQTLPFLARQRVVLLRQLEQFAASDRELILSYAKNPVKRNLLILETAETNLAPDFFRQLCKYVVLILCNPLSGTQSFSWIKTQVEKRSKKKIDNAACQFLVENLGSDLQLLTNSLESLLMFIGEKQTIGVVDVEKLVGPDVTASAFELFDALSRRNQGKAWGILDGLFKDGVDAAQILGALAYKITSQRSSVRAPFSFSRFIKDLQATDADIKTGRQQPRLALELLLARQFNLADALVRRD